MTCNACGHELQIGDFPFCGGDPEKHQPVKRFAVAGDDIPGGMYVKHAICHPDGTPKRYDSKSAIREAANKAGWTISGETPKDPGARWV